MEKADDKEKDEDGVEKGKAMIRIAKVGIIISPLYPKRASHFLFFPSQAEVSKSGVTMTIILVRTSVSENLPW